MRTRCSHQNDSSLLQDEGSSQHHGHTEVEKMYLFICRQMGQVSGKNNNKAAEDRYVEEELARKLWYRDSATWPRCD